jgi:hypothetical protein
MQKKWTTRTSKKSLASRALARFFCGLLIGLNVGINAAWISTKANVLADKISWLALSPFPNLEMQHDRKEC